MILRRLGNKARIAKEIQKHFPPHKIYIEPFFGAGGMFFNKPKAKCNILNDLDNDVYNLFDVIKNNPEDFRRKIELTPYSDYLFKHWVKNEEKEKVWKAVRFVFLSNFGFLGNPCSLKIDSRNHKKNAVINFDKTVEFLKDLDVKFTCLDFHKSIKSVSLSEENNIAKTLIYNDPPYLGTNDNYSNSFTKQDTIDLFETNIQTGCKFAISEFNNPFILDLAKQYNLEVITIGERQNLKNRRTEILIVNYESPALYGLFGSRNLCAV